MEAQAERVHEDRMAECKAEIKQASQTGKLLLSEVSACHKKCRTWNSLVQHRHQSEMTRLGTNLVEDGERNKAEALDSLGLRFKQVLNETEQSLHAAFNERLQDELAAAERALRMESAAKGFGARQPGPPSRWPIPPIPRHRRHGF